MLVFYRVIALMITDGQKCRMKNNETEKIEKKRRKRLIFPFKNMKLVPLSLLDS